MENKIEYNGKTLKWEYDICACLSCPLFPMIKEWENEKDKRKDKCYTSRCTYNSENARQIANEIAFLRDNHYCDECDEYFDKDELFQHCPICGTDFD